MTSLACPPAPPAFEPARFRPLRRLGQGGLSTVYLARDAELNRDVALKVMRRRYEASGWARARLRFEAEVTAGLEHPGVVPVYGVGHDDRGRACFAMRYIRGENLEQAVAGLREMPSPQLRRRGLRRLVDRLVDVCYTVAFAHERQVLHRDLTPGNIMLGQHGETLVVDWGLARWVGTVGPDTPADLPDWPASRRDLSVTRIGQVVGTPRYLCPEQAEGAWDRLGPPADVFGLGATLYHVLTGRAPFEAADEPTSLNCARRADFPAPRAVDRRIPAALESICLKAMLRDPAARYADPLALGDDLTRWLDGEPVSVARRPILRAWSRQATTASPPLTPP